MVARIVEFVCECGGRCAVKELIKALQGKKETNKETKKKQCVHIFIHVSLVNYLLHPPAITKNNNLLNFQQWMMRRWYMMLASTSVQVQIS
jgi:hypothetical protein